MELLTEIIPAIAEAYASSGKWAALATFLILSVRIYRLEGIQNILPEHLKWVSLSPTQKIALPFWLSLVGSLTLSMLGGASVGASIAGALSAATLSIGGHHATKLLGVVEHKNKPTDYKPSPFRRVASLAVPMPSAPVIKSNG